MSGRRTRRARPAGEPGGHPEDAPGDPESVARAICLRQLAAAPRTRAQLADTLARRDIPDDVASRVLARFGEVGLIDDAMFAQAWVSSRHLGRGLSRRALSAELRQRGVDPETTSEAVGALDAADEEAAARQLVRRRLRSLGSVEPVARQRRLLGMLARKGYSSGLAFRVIREELAQLGEDCDDLVPADDT
jgi:regulatory protein